MSHSCSLRGLSDLPSQVLWVDDLHLSTVREDEPDELPAWMQLQRGPFSCVPSAGVSRGSVRCRAVEPQLDGFRRLPPSPRSPAACEMLLQIEPFSFPLPAHFPDAPHAVAPQGLDLAARMFPHDGIDVPILHSCQR